MLELCVFHSSPHPLIYFSNNYLPREEVFIFQILPDSRTFWFHSRIHFSRQLLPRKIQSSKNCHLLELCIFYPLILTSVVIGQRNSFIYSVIGALCAYHWVWINLKIATLQMFPNAPSTTYLVYGLVSRSITNVRHLALLYIHFGLRLLYFIKY